MGGPPASATPAPGATSSPTGPRRAPCWRGSPALGAGLWDELETDWLCLDAELMPWSVKAQALLGQQYAAVGPPAARAARRRRRLGRRGAARSGGRDAPAASATPGSSATRRRRRRAVRRRLPALLLAGAVARRPQAGAVPPPGQRGAGAHRPQITSGTWRPWPLAGADPELFLATPYRVVTLADGSRGRATRLVGGADRPGGEGMVVKPLDFVAEGPAGPGPAGDQVPGGVPAPHLRPRVHRAGAPGAPAPAAWAPSVPPGVFPGEGRRPCSSPRPPPVLALKRAEPRL